MTSLSETHFKQNYQTHLKHLKLKGLQPKTVDAYSRAIRRLGEYFDHQLNDLSETQLLEYFTDLLETHSWSSVVAGKPLKPSRKTTGSFRALPEPLLFCTRIRAALISIRISIW